MHRFECSPQRPWGIHAPVRNHEDCPRCGWTAPGPHGDARARRAETAAALAAKHGWALIAGGGQGAPAVQPMPEPRTA